MTELFAGMPGTSGVNSAELAKLSTLVARAPVLGESPGWRFRYRGGQIDIVLAPSTVDGPGAERAWRLAVISAAAAVVNLRLVIGHLGYEPQVDLDHGGPVGLLARVSAGRQRPAVPDEERLFAGLARLPEGAAPQPAAEAGDAEVDDDDLGHVIDAGVRAAAADLEIVEPHGAAATAIDAALAGNGADDADGGGGSGGAGSGWRIPSGTGALRSLVIVSRRDDPGAWLATGQALQAIRLEAVCRGLGAHSGVPSDHGAYNRAALGRIAVPHGPDGLVQVGVQLHPITVL
ncbi:hypothetical protein [Flindersiella endophytica]